MREALRNRIDMLESVIASLKNYPNFGGEGGVMKEVERLKNEGDLCR